jgi:hypothetical protein
VVAAAHDDQVLDAPAHKQLLHHRHPIIQKGRRVSIGRRVQTIANLNQKIRKIVAMGPLAWLYRKPRSPVLRYSRAATCRHTHTTQTPRKVSWVLRLATDHEAYHYMIAYASGRKVGWQPTSFSSPLASEALSWAWNTSYMAQKCTKIEH